MRKVLIDNQVFDLQQVGGISKQFANLAANLKNYEPVLGFEHSNNIYVNELNLIKNVNPNTNNTACSIYRVSQGDFDIYHPTYFYPFYINDLKKPFVLTIHDMIVEHGIKEENKKLDKDTKVQVEGKRILAEKASKIITVSEYSKKDIIDILKVPEDKIEVCYPGADADFAQYEDNIDFINKINAEYILYVGKRFSTKNFGMLYDEFKNFIHPNFPDLKLIFVGPVPKQIELELIFQDHLEKHIMAFNKLSEKTLATLYRHAKCFIFPSYFEGFGLPIVEGFMTRCPVLLNNTSCFPEIGKDAAMYFDLTEKKNTFKETFQKFMDLTPDELKTMLDKGEEYAKEYTWQNFAAKVEKVYDEVLDGKN